MKTYCIKTTVSKDGTLLIQGVPFQPGDQVEVTVRRSKRSPRRRSPYPLRGKPIHYANPFESVAEKDWDAFK